VLKKAKIVVFVSTLEIPYELEKISFKLSSPVNLIVSLNEFQFVKEK
jgi:hypothetical protein